MLKLSFIYFVDTFYAQYCANDDDNFEVELNTAMTMLRRGLLEKLRSSFGF